MAYKEKTCPKCGVTHKKRGAYCSRSCGNQKKHTEEAKQKIGEAKRAWLNSGDERAEVEKHNYISKRANGDPDPIPPAKPIDIGYGRFVEDGDIWEEVN
jgi:hypothetical protein